MRESVSAIFVFEDEVFSIQRQNYLSVFPGYCAFPGGKVDKEDSNVALVSHDLFADKESYQLNALFREVSEELNFDVLANLNRIVSIDMIGIAITPEFNPYRFKNFYFRITLNEKVSFVVDEGEAKSARWSKAHELLERYERAEILAVPPAVKLFKALDRDIQFSHSIDLSLEHDPATETPMIESLYGVKQFLPLSHTFPPANRTNCFLIGDKHSVLIDPSPKDEIELAKLKNHLSKFQVNEIFLTHHHPDHHEHSVELAKFYDVKIGLSLDTHTRILSKHGQDYFQNLELNYYKEGDILTQSLGQDVLVYEVPGHDEGQLALAPRNLNWFIVGDLIQSVGTVVIGAPEGDMSKYFNSLEKVIKLAPRFVIPSHGIALGGVHKLKMTLKHRKMREEKIRSLLEHSHTNEEILDIIYEGLDKRLTPYALKTIEAHIVKIKSELT
ncbi:MBL fold metallo-hydrolase [Halobacteriovorax sp. HLS]|uniref:MBL fold metallo-hydrolase n=1 Tax=Halobacteriovorax sp. HLS TaxID=2234000 RepID=UPI000FDA20F7|nr:MBL fold metallo-hydrolase [Halobacteriovorax sp. HLS]